MTPHGPWTILESHLVYRDPWTELRKDDVIRPDGENGTHTVVRIKPGVSVLAIDTNNNVHLTDEFHYAIGRNSLEVVSGGTEPGESALESARRELREELGIEAAEWMDAGSVDPFTTSLLSPTTLYIARQLTFVDADPDGTELIRRVEMPLAEAERLAMTGGITHAPSVVLILKAFRLLAGSL
ncbi:MAG: NUDIX domain-containing protein [Planctomycetaceae bacterium]